MHLPAELNNRSVCGYDISELLLNMHRSAELNNGSVCGYDVSALLLNMHRSAELNNRSVCGYVSMVCLGKAVSTAHVVFLYRHRHCDGLGT